MKPENHPMVCDTCGTIGTEDDGIEVGGECAHDDCNGTIRSTLIDRICEALTDDGDEYALDDARTLRLKIEPEYEIHPMDMWSDDCYGKVAPVEWSRWERKQMPRPDGFDGRARKLYGSTQGECYWWQPPADVGDERLPELQSLVHDILTMGFYSIGIELIEGHDAYRRDIVREAVWLGGVEPLQNDESSKGYYAEIIREQVEELLAIIEGES